MSDANVQTTLANQVLEAVESIPEKTNSEYKTKIAKAVLATNALIAVLKTL